MVRLITIYILLLCSATAYGQGKISRTTPHTNTSSSKVSTKLSVSGTANGHDYVDLGLPSGMLWATTNIGSASPAGYGNYYSWAETSPKNTYTKDNSKTYNLSRYADGLGDIKSDTVRAIVRIYNNPKYDAATSNWGQQWQMPSSDDFAELNKHCSWQLRTIDGHKGYLITGPNGNSMYLPMAGYMDQSHKCQVGSGGFYWTGDFWDDVARSTMFDYHEGSHNGVIWSYRHTGKSIRPVLHDRKSQNSFNWSNE